jgi:hypothetical protein
MVAAGVPDGVMMVAVVSEVGWVVAGVEILDPRWDQQMGVRVVPVVVVVPGDTSSDQHNDRQSRFATPDQRA